MEDTKKTRPSKSIWAKHCELRLRWPAWSMRRACTEHVQGLHRAAQAPHWALCARAVASGLVFLCDFRVREEAGLLASFPPLCLVKLHCVSFVLSHLLLSLLRSLVVS